MSGRNKRNLQSVSFTPITKEGDEHKTKTTSTKTSQPPTKQPKLTRQATPHVRKSISKVEDEEEEEEDAEEEEEAEEEEQKESKTSSKKSSFTSSSKSSPAIKPTSTPTETILTSTSTSTPTPTLPPVIPTSTATTPRKVIILLIKSSLETIKTKRGYELVSADTHKSILTKLNKDPSAYRPDITHQCLLTLLDSPLNKAGHLQVYIQTEKNVLIEVNPSLRVPRTFRRFAGLMVQLLHKLKIRASDGSDVLLKVIKNPITAHLPAGAFKFGTSVTGELVHFPAFASTLPTTDPVVLVCGAHASGPAEVDWVMKNIAISQYGLSASVALGRICNAFENMWEIL